MSKITKRIKDALRPLVRKLEASRLAPFCAFLLDSFRMARYRLLGRPHIAPDDVKNVEENVTFIFKSFNRFDREYAKYRSDTKGDALYIRQKHGPEYYAK